MAREAAETSEMILRLLVYPILVAAFIFGASLAFQLLEQGSDVAVFAGAILLFCVTTIIPYMVVQVTCSLVKTLKQGTRSSAADY